MADEQKPNIDERLQALTMNVELLTHDIEQMRKEAREMDARERRGRQAILRGIAEYMRALNGEDGDQ